MPSFLHFLRFLYTGRTDTIEPAHALDILTMTGTDEGDDEEEDDEIEDDDDEDAGHLRRGSGGFFQIRNSHHLRRQCRQRLEHGVTVGNVVALLCRAHSIANEVGAAILTTDSKTEPPHLTDYHGCHVLSSCCRP